MGIAFLLASLLAVAQVRSTEILPTPPAFAVEAERETVTISVQPAKGTVRGVIIDLPDSRSWAKPTRRESLDKNGARATFRHPRAPYALVVTLDDDTQWRVSVVASGRLDVRAIEGPAVRGFALTERS